MGIEGNIVCRIIVADLCLSMAGFYDGHMEFKDSLMSCDLFTLPFDAAGRYHLRAVSLRTGSCVAMLGIDL